ncbi:MAG: restriction endonuclease subunit S [Ruminococcus sp.]
MSFLFEYIDINPKETIIRGCLAKKIPMDKLQPFCRDIPEYETSEFNGGSKFRNGDTIMARITPCLENGKTAMVNILDSNEVGFGSTEYIVFRAKKNLTTPDFVYYLICSSLVRDPAIKSMVGSSGRQRVQTDVIANLDIDFPKLSDQVKIAGVLKSLDDKIALNNAINNNLEQQYISIVDNLLSKLTQYKIYSLLEVADCQNGRAFYKEGYDPNGAFVIDLGNVNTSGNFVRTAADKYISLDRYKEPKLEKYRVYKNDIVMVMTDRKSTMELLGKVGKIYKDGYYLLNQRMYRIRAKEGINTNYLYACLNSTETSNFLKRKALGSVQKYVNTGEINSIEIKVPSSEKMEEIASILDPIFLQMESNILENESLNELRDILLPKLMSGELDVSGIDL